MKKVLILCIHRPGRSPSQRFRFEQFLPFLEKNGYEFTFSYLLNAEDDKAYYQNSFSIKKLQILAKSIYKRTWQCLTISRYDLVFVQREAFMLGTAFFEKIMAKKRPLIFDFDDSIWIQNVSEANKKLAFLKDASKTSTLIKCARLIFAGNSYLANYAHQYNTNVAIIPTTIDTAIYKNAFNTRLKKNTICIGWSGSFSTIEHFATAIPALEKIKSIYGDRVSFKIIGDPNYYCQPLQTKGQAWVAGTEIEDLSGIDIGIMPLPDTEWAKGKCGLKGLQYMALGIPTLMSPVGVNTEIIQNGINGFLPSSDQEWVNNLVHLIENEELRHTIGETGRETVVQKYSTLAWQQTYLAHFNAII